MHGMVYEDRRHAGRVLARDLTHLAERGGVLVLGLPRGGLPVAYEVAQALNAPLDVFLVRKLGAPGREELAMGAIAMGGVQVMNPDIVHWLDVGPEEIERITDRERQEMLRRNEAYRGNFPLPHIDGKTVIVVDDGLATGATMRAAVTAIRTFHPAKIIAAAPVGAPDVCEKLQRDADQVICPNQPEPFDAVGAWYLDFSQTPDKDVRLLLEKARDLRGME
jgi:predicted phosphoribosyltransferase